MRVLVTGAAGFVGRHLVRKLHQDGHEVCGVGRGSHVDRALELPDEEAARALVADFEPEAVYHLAALAETRSAEADPKLALRVNVEGTVSLLEAICSERPACRFFHVSTSSVYGQVPSNAQPITEDARLCPVNVYGWSKVAAEAYLQSFESRLERPPVIVRPFNHVGPGQQSAYALPGFARQIVEIERGMQPPTLRVGNLQVRRDILDVRDVVEAYARLLVSPDAAGIYNLCSDRAYVLENLVERMLAQSEGTARLEVEAERVRGNDAELVVGDSSRLRAAIDWEPTIAMEQTLTDLLDDWRLRLSQAEERSGDSGDRTERGTIRG